MELNSDSYWIPEVCCLADAPERVLDRVPELLECLAAAAREGEPNALHQQRNDKRGEHQKTQGLSKQERSGCQGRQ